MAGTIIAVASAAAIMVGATGAGAAGRATTHGQVDGTPAINGPLIPLGIPGHWRLTLNASPRQIYRTWTPWATNGQPVNSYEYGCYGRANVKLYNLSVVLLFTHEASTCAGMKKAYTGAAVTSRGVFTQQFGVFEAKISMTQNNRKQVMDWPAFWVYGGHRREVDIAEGLGGRVHQVVHTPAGRILSHGNTMTHGWHIYAVWIGRSWVRFYYDGKQVSAIRTTQLGQPMTMVLDMSAGPRMQVPLTAPTQIRVAWVRAWIQRRH